MEMTEHTNKRRGSGTRVTPCEAEMILCAYRNGMSKKEAAAVCGWSVTVCVNILKKHGIESRKYSERQHFWRKYAVDETFFDQIDTEAKAYWLGFLTADGYPANSRLLTADGYPATSRVIDIGLQRGDEAHLRKLRDALKSTHPIHRETRKVKGKVHHQSRIRIGSKRLSRALNKLGALAYGQLAGLCTSVPVNLQHHYWRGSVDGDGWILHALPPKRRTLTWMTGLCGSHEIVQGYVDFIDKRLGHPHEIYPHGKIYRVDYNGLALPRSIVELLYTNAHVFLERKKKAADILMQIKDRHRKCPYDGKYLETLHSKYKTWNAVAEFLGFPPGTLSPIALKWRRENAGVKHGVS